jgi:hypothetical protein
VTPKPFAVARQARTWSAAEAPSRMTNAMRHAVRWAKTPPTSMLARLAGGAGTPGARRPRTCPQIIDM